MKEPLEFSNFRFEPEQRRLLEDGQPVAISPKGLDLLALLLERPGVLVTREELMAGLWAETAVEEGNLAFQVSTLRKILQSGEGKVTCIETVPKYGYRFIAEIRSTSPAPPDTPPPLSPPVPARWLRLKLVLAALGFFVALVATVYGVVRWSRHAPQSVNSLAVLPFLNMSGDPDNDYLSDGFTEEIINSLCRIPNLRVISRTSAFVYKRKQSDVREIGRQLEVSNLLEGSVRRFGDRIRVTAQLIDAKDGAHVWSHVWEERFSDVFAIQQSIADNIAARLVRDKQSSSRPAPKPPPDMVAYEQYLRGRNLLDQIGPSDMRRSIAYFEESIARDPSFALGHVGLGYAWLRRYLWAAIPEQEGLSRAREAIRKGLDLDPASSEGHAVLGTLLHFHDWDHQRAEIEFRRSVELAPGSSFAYGQYATMLSNRGRHEESFEKHRHAASLDPLDPRKRSGLALAFFHARRYSDAVQQCDSILKEAPDYVRAHLLRSLALTELGSFDDALAEIDQCMRIVGSEPNYLAWRAYILAAAGRLPASRAILQTLETDKRETTAISAHLALVYSRIGDKPRALHWLENAARLHDAFLVQLNVEPGFDGIRGEPAFQRIRTQVNPN